MKKLFFALIIVFCFTGCYSNFNIYSVKDKYELGTIIYSTNDVLLQRENSIDNVGVFLRFINYNTDTVNTFMYVIYSGSQFASLQGIKLKINTKVIEPKILEYKLDKDGLNNKQEHLVVLLPEDLLNRMNKDLNVSMLIIGGNRNFDYNLSDLTIKKIYRFHSFIKSKVRNKKI